MNLYREVLKHSHKLGEPGSCAYSDMCAVAVLLPKETIEQLVENDWDGDAITDIVIYMTKILPNYMYEEHHLFQLRDMQIHFDNFERPMTREEFIHWLEFKADLYDRA